MSKEKKAIKQLKNKNEDAFDFLYYKYVRLVYHVIFMIIENKDDTEDLVQETFIKAYNAIDSFDIKNNFKYWLLTIAKNNAFDLVRKRKRRNETNNYNLEQIPSYDSTEKTDFHDILSKYKFIITKDEYNIITLHIFEGLKFREIAIIYNKTTSSVNNIYIRGINKIKKYIKELN